MCRLTFTYIHNVYACVLVIDGLGYETLTTTMPVSHSRTRTDVSAKSTTLFSSVCCAEAVGIAHKLLGSLSFENKLDTHKRTQTDRPSTVTLAAHVRLGLIRKEKSKLGYK